jgi:hypothetical protein
VSEQVDPGRLFDLKLVIVAIGRAARVNATTLRRLLT